MKLILGIEVAVLAMLGLVIADQMAHKRVQMQAGVNAWGYRGPVMPMRRGDEWRVAVLGGDRAFGWGVGPEEAMPAYLRTELSRRLTGDAGILVANLGAVALPARDYAGRVLAYAYLRPDVVCLYIDLIDRSSAALLPRQDSAITALTGYVPMLPLLLRDKSAQLGAAGRPWVSALTALTSRSLESIDRTLYRLAGPAVSQDGEPHSVSIRRAVDEALKAAREVVVVLPMPLNAAEEPVHQAARELLATRVAGEPRLRLVDLRDTPALADPALRLDALHFGAAGHSITATAVAPTILAAIERARAKA